MSFLAQADFNYQLRDFFLLNYIEWKFHLGLFNRGEIPARFNPFMTEVVII